MIKKRFIFGPAILAFVLFIGLIAVPNEWLMKLLPENQLHEAANSLSSNMFAGTFLQDKMLEDPKFLPIYGSSELSRWDPFHPSNYFQVNPIGYEPFLIGKGGSTSIVHAINLANHVHQLHQKKMVIIVSPQWFVKRGTDEQHFAPNYSSLQALKLPYNQDIAEKVKRKIMKRMLSYEAVKNDQLVFELFSAYLHNEKATFHMLTPFAKMYINILEKKDLYFSIFGIHSSQDQLSDAVKDQSWSSLMKQASALGEQNTRHSRFYIDDQVYKKSINHIRKLKGKNTSMSYGVSKEYKDFQLILDILKQSDAEPLFVIIPVNGPYYDYTGFHKKGRTDYYKRVKKQIRSNGFEYADYSEHEYDPYFMKDTIHIALKGWVYLDRDIESFLKTGKADSREMKVEEKQ